MKRSSGKEVLVYCVFGLVPVVWFALLIAPYTSGGVVDIAQNITSTLSSPFNIIWSEDSPRVALVFVLLYATGIGVYLSTRRNRRPKEEHGSARWGDVRKVNKKYAEVSFCENKILTQNVRIGFDGKKHRRNVNTLVCGGSGAGKTRFFAKPNVMNMSSSMVVLDPKGEILSVAIRVA